MTDLEKDLKIAALERALSQAIKQHDLAQLSVRALERKVKSLERLSRARLQKLKWYRARHVKFVGKGRTKYEEAKGLN